MQFETSWLHVVCKKECLLALDHCGNVLGFKINEVCDARFDLNFTLVGYSCEFIGSGVYSVNGLPVDFVRFDRFNEQSFIYLDLRVTSVTIENGSPAICSNILLGRGTVDEIIIGGKVCVSFNTNYTVVICLCNIILKKSFKTGCVMR